jgi:2-polyprenyl-6-hydroxyphenyl methylase/3-demethylubiquinone-9 3-methyltransferase
MAESQYVYHDYEQADPPHQPLYLDLVLRHLKSSSDIVRVLDAGCGDGNFTASVAEAGFQMFGLDQSSGGIAKATQRYPHIRFFSGSVYDDFRFRCGVDAFDAIIAVEVIEHLYSPQQFVRRVHEALSPGGVFIVTTPYWGYAKNIILALSNRMDRALTALWEGGHIKHWSFKTLRKLLEIHGFEYVAFHGVGRRIPYCWSGMVIVVRKPMNPEGNRPVSVNTVC